MSALEIAETVLGLAYGLLLIGWPFLALGITWALSAAGHLIADRRQEDRAWAENAERDNAELAGALVAGIRAGQL